jgi:hypothetical protein
MATGDEWVCQCRRCHGVHSAADAVQEVWESALGSCGVPVVVGVEVGADGVVLTAHPYWHGEPNRPDPISDLDEFIVSCRPDEGTMPTEGDIARWVQWEAGPHTPRDWLIVDGTHFRSVRMTVDALRTGAAMPDEQAIVGDWDGPLLDPEFRRRACRQWPDTVQRNQANSRR